MKLYIHHYYDKSIFYKLAHNTTDREYFIENGEGIVKCKYGHTDFELVFKQEISFEDDGYHLLDYFTALLYGNNDPKIGHIKRDNQFMDNETQQILSTYHSLIKNCPSNQKWIITFFRTEKILQTNDLIESNSNWDEIEKILSKFNNHYIITDNIFLNTSLEKKYSNFFYALTNTIFQWNDMIGIRWFYEFNEIYKKLNFDYDLMYSIRNHKKNRVDTIKELNKLKIKRLLLQRSNSLKNDDYLNNSKYLFNIPINSVKKDSDFSDIEYIENNKGYMDVFFRVLPKAKMQILCESWSWGNREYSSQYLSEKTIGLILSGIPFVSTHEYPLQILQKILDLPPHPFYLDSLNCRGKSKQFAIFIKQFINNFDENYILCKEWSDSARDKMIKLVETQNSLLDLIINDFPKSNIVYKSII